MAANEPKNIKVIHHLQNGEIVESMDGHMVPVTPRTEALYQLLASWQPKDETA